MRRKAGIAVTAALVVCMFQPAEACLQMGANFWNLNWQGDQAFIQGGQWGSWNATFISQIQIYSSLRFMDWNAVNMTAASSWANRVQKSAGCSQCNNQNSPIAYEWQIDVVNHVPGCSYWLNVPCKADSIYVDSLAVLVHSLLGTGRKVYLEYANETWWEPASVTYVTSAGNALGSGLATINGVWGNANFLGHCYLAAQMWTWFRKAWRVAGGDTGLCIRVLAGQAGYGSAEECHYMLEAIANAKVNPSGQKCDLFAIAPYFDGDPASAESMVSSHYNWCKAKGVSLCCYEGGPDGNPSDSATMTKYVSMLDTYINGPYNQYTHSGGQWGAVENGYYKALADWVQTHSCNPSYTAVRAPFRAAKPSAPSLRTLLADRDTKLYSLDGQRMPALPKRRTAGCFIAVVRGSPLVRVYSLPKNN
jgi:hypothetical protein